MTFVKVTKQHLQDMHDKGMASLVSEVTIFYRENDIDIINMNDKIRDNLQGREFFIF